MRFRDNSLVLLLLGFVISTSLFTQEAKAESQYEIFLPDKMIIDQSYHGVIVANPGVFEDTKILFSVNDDSILQLEPEIILKQNKNHGIFEIIPTKQGSTTLYASIDGEILSSYVTVYSKQSGPQKLQVILPGESTIASELRGLVFLLDGGNSPVAANADTVISLISSEKIITPSQITIRNGTSSQEFDFVVRASGNITAISHGLDSHSAGITKNQDDVKVKFAVAPDIALEDSYVNYFIWLEKNEKPFSVPYRVDIELQTDDAGIVRFDVTPVKHTNHDIKKFSMYDGLATGKLYTGEGGTATIFVSVKNYGTASTTLSVGSTTQQNGISSPAIPHENHSKLKPNTIKLWVYPGMAGDVAYGVAGLYHTLQEKEINTEFDPAGEEDQIFLPNHTFIPINSHGTSISLTTPYGVEHRSDYMVDGAFLPSNSKIFEITTNNVGHYRITATGVGSSDTAELDVTTTYNSQHSILATPAPIKPNNPQPIIMASLVDSNNNIIDVSETFGKIVELKVHATDGLLGGDDTIRFTGKNNVGVFSSSISSVNNVTFSSPLLGSTILELVPTGVPISIEILTPNRIHSGEPFPVAVHAVDSRGVPIYKEDIITLQGTGFDVLDDDIILIDGDDSQSISILTSIGAYSDSVDLFLNSFDFTPKLQKSNVRIGEKITLEIESPTRGVEYSINGPFPAEKIDSDSFVIFPDHETVDSPITITGFLEGFETVTKQLRISSENVVEIKTYANTLAGKPLSPLYDIDLGDTVISGKTPDGHYIKPQQIVVRFPSDWSTAAGGYSFVGYEVNGELVNERVLDVFAGSDHSIIALYDRFVQITVNNGHGGGIYQYNTTVPISAPDKQKIPILLVERFDHWIDSNTQSSSFTIQALEDTEFTAVYKDDFTGTMILIALVVVGIVIVSYRRDNSTLGYKISNLIDLIRKRLNFSIPKIRK